MYSFSLSSIKYKAITIYFNKIIREYIWVHNLFLRKVLEVLRILINIKRLCTRFLK